MREVICPKCGASYEQHPLDSAHQELCPTCRNNVSWDEIRKELNNASKLKISAAIGATPGVQPGPRAGV